MTDIVLVPITSGYNVSRINANFEKIEEAINNDVLNLSGGNNTMLQDLDMNNFSLLNLATDPGNPESMLTVAQGDLRYYNVAGDMLEGVMDVNGQAINNLAIPTLAHQPVRKDMLDAEISARVAGDVSLQDQLNGTNPPMGSAFSIVSWHNQVITNSITIPDKVNAWSFGPVISIDIGQVVEVGADSFWTIANGATAGSGPLEANMPDPLDYGVL